MNKIFATAAMAIAASGLTVAAPASAAVGADYAAPSQTSAHTAVFGDLSADHSRKYKKKYRNGRGYDNYRRNDRYYNDRYDGDRVSRNTRVWRGNDGRYYCRKDNGTTGLLIGAGVGALAGHEIAGRGDRTLGAILGAAGGALLGREIDRSSTRCR